VAVGLQAPSPVALAAQQLVPPLWCQDVARLPPPLLLPPLLLPVPVPVPVQVAPQH